MNKLQILALAQFIVVSFSIASAYRNETVKKEAGEFNPSCDSLLKAAESKLYVFDSTIVELRFQIEKKDLMLDQLSIRLNDEISKNITKDKNK